MELDQDETVTQPTGGGGYLLEYRPFLKMCTVYIRPSCDDLRVRLRSNQVEFYSQANCASLQLQMPESSTIDLDHLSEWNQLEWVRTRDEDTLTTPCLPSTSSSDTAVVRFKIQNLANVSLPTSTVETLPFKEGRCYQLRCKECLQYLLEEAVAFRRMMPLPSGETSVSSSEWFCHPPHDQHTQTESGGNCETRSFPAAKVVEQAARLENEGRIDVQHIKSDFEERTSREPVQNCSGDNSELSLPLSLTPKPDELFFSLNKFVVHKVTTSDDLKSYMLAGAALCPGCQTIVGHLDLSGSGERPSPAKESQSWSTSSTAAAATATMADRNSSVAFYRVRVDLVEVSSGSHVGVESSVPLAPLTAQRLVAKLCRELILYNLQSRLLLLSESSPDVLVLWIVESDVLVFGGEFSFAGRHRREKVSRDVQFRQVHKVLYMRASRSSPDIQRLTSDISVLSQKVLKDSLDEVSHELVHSTEFCKYAYTDKQLEGYTLGLLSAIA